MERHRLKACTRIDIHLHHCGVSSQVKHGSSVTTPSRVASATRRDLPFSTDRSSRKLPYVNLGTAVLIGHVRDEMAIRRKPAIALIEFCGRQRRRLAIAFEWENPEIEFSFGIQ